MRILLVEDDAELSGAVERRLRASGFAVSVLDGWLEAGHQEILHRSYETLPIFE